LVPLSLINIFCVLTNELDKLEKQPIEVRDLRKIPIILEENSRDSIEGNGG
jgi:hypothetical protein